MIPSTRAVHTLSCSVLLCILAAGCAPVERLPTGIRAEAGHARAAEARSAPGSDPGEAGFYPLAIGNHWVYSGWSCYWERSPGSDTTAMRATWTREQTVTGLAVLDGREYFRIDMTDSRAPVIYTSYLRQDRTGLYEWAPPWVPGPEHLVLRYPLHHGASWTLLSDIVFIVEGREVVHTPLGRIPAWRVRFTGVGEPAGTANRLWFGACGLVGTVNTTDRDYIDSDGEHVVFHAEEREWLSAVELVEQEPQVPGVVTIPGDSSLRQPASWIRPWLGSGDSPAALFDRDLDRPTQLEERAPGHRGHR